jgi:hypothetical protein
MAYKFLSDLEIFRYLKLTFALVFLSGSLCQGQYRTVNAPENEPCRIWQSMPPDNCPFKKSDEIIGVGFTGRHREYTTADTWYPSWGGDDRLYSPFTDGVVNGVGSTSYGSNPVIGHAIIEGSDPLNLAVNQPGIIPGSPAPYEGRYPCGSLMYNGVWYIGTYALANAPYGLNWPILGPCVGFHISKDFGKTWIPSPHSAKPGEALFPEPEEFKGPVKIGAPHFVDFGKNMEHSPDGKAYLVGHGSTEKDLEERKANLSWITGDQIYLCRVIPSIENINDESKYEYFSGSDEKGQPVWTNDFSKIKPLIEWDNNMGCVTVTYNAPLKKYLMCITDGATTMSKFNTYILDSDQITGPWRLITYMKDFGQQAYFVNIPSKFISDDGMTFWLCYSANFTNNYAGTRWLSFPRGSNYHMCLQEVKLLEPGYAKPKGPLVSDDNIAYYAQITASSTHPDYNLESLIDGVVDGYPGDISKEWTSFAEKDTAMVRLTWNSPQKINKIWLFDRPNTLDQVKSGMLFFSDGSTVEFGQLPDDAKTGLEVTFEPKEVKWMVVIISETKPSTLNIGLSELAVFRAKID